MSEKHSYLVFRDSRRQDYLESEPNKRTVFFQGISADYRPAYSRIACHLHKTWCRVFLYWVPSLTYICVSYSGEHEKRRDTFSCLVSLFKENSLRVLLQRKCRWQAFLVLFERLKGSLVVISLNIPSLVFFFSFFLFIFLPCIESVPQCGVYSSRFVSKGREELTYTVSICSWEKTGRWQREEHLCLSFFVWKRRKNETETKL